MGDGGNGGGLVETRHFRLYWLALNTAYVMEFFMQTLVKKGYIGQGRMLRMNQFLMVTSSLAAVRVLGWDWCKLSSVDPWLERRTVSNS